MELTRWTFGSLSLSLSNSHELSLELSHMRNAYSLAAYSHLHGLSLSTFFSLFLSPLSLSLYPLPSSCLVYMSAHVSILLLPLLLIALASLCSSRLWQCIALSQIPTLCSRNWSWSCVLVVTRPMDFSLAFRYVYVRVCVCVCFFFVFLKSFFLMCVRRLLLSLLLAGGLVA
jgi:hypothetical protein